MDTTRIIGIDCGTAINGWAVIEVNHKSKVSLISCGVIKTHKFTPEPDRLKDIGDSTAELIKEYNPKIMVLEDIFFFKNAKTVIKVSQARGVIIYQGLTNNLEIISYTPLQVKQQITGYGRADKKQIQFMVNTIFKLKTKLVQDDAADALAIAYCHYLNLKTPKV